MALYKFISVAFLQLSKATGLNKKIYYIEPILSDDKDVCGRDFDATWLTNWFDIENTIKELGFSIKGTLSHFEGRIVRIMRSLRFSKVLQSFYLKMRNPCVIVGIKKMKPQVEPNHYFNKSYDVKERFISYWHQINEIIKLCPKRVLEIGIGNGFTTKYLKERRVNVLTLDIDKMLNPDIVGSILDIPLPDKSFDVVACYEILEHLPYEDFSKALSEIFRVSKSYAILSLPDAGRVYRIYIQIPKIGIFKKLISLPRIQNPIHKFDGEHYWEIGKAGYSLSKITKDIKEAGFKILKTYRIFENPYHRFFVLKKEKQLNEKN